MAKLLAASIIAAWVVAIAIVSVQNATPVSLQFFGLRSIEIPFGVLLAFCAAAGMLGTALVLPVAVGRTGPTTRR